MTTLDPSAKRALVMTGAPPPPLETLSPEEARAVYLDGVFTLQWPPEPVHDVAEHKIGGLRLKVWRGHGIPRDNAPALLYLHGGGFVIGSPESHEDICRILANAAGGVVVSPDYRLAPEHPFPAALEDCAATLRWMRDQAAMLGIDAGRIVVAGDSAGGNLAAVTALMARDGDVPSVVGQLLIYPVTDQHQTAQSYTDYADGYGLTTAGMRWFRDHYLPKVEDRSDWRASPLFVPSLSGVAPAYVVLAGHDVLYSEGLAYAERLTAETTARFRLWPGQIHGFVSMGRAIPEAREALEATAAAWTAMHSGNFA